MRRAASGAVIKTCACGRAYDAEGWARLPLAGTGEWRLPWGEVQELRNCACGSTIAIVLEPGEADPEAAAVRHDEVARCGRTLAALAEES